MKVYLLNASAGSYDEMEEKLLGVFTTVKKAEAAKQKFDKEHETSDYYGRIFTGIQEIETDVLGVV